MSRKQCFGDNIGTHYCYVNSLHEFGFILVAQMPSECGGRTASSSLGFILSPSLAGLLDFVYNQDNQSQQMTLRDPALVICPFLVLNFLQFQLDCFWLGTIECPFKNDLNNEDNVAFRLTRSSRQLTIG